MVVEARTCSVVHYFDLDMNQGFHFVVAIESDADFGPLRLIGWQSVNV